MSASEGREGLLYGLVAYGLWGFFPVYWKQLSDVPAIQILAYRMVLSLVFIIALLLLLRRTAWIKAVARDGKTIALYFLAAVFLTFNWGTYIWAVNAGYIVETSLGYFINPLINVVLGAFFLAERPRKGQWFAIAVAACGVLFLTVQYGQPPWIALLLAMSFACYGLIKKKAKLEALEGLSLETALVFPPALGFLIYCHVQGVGALGQVSAWETTLLLGSGIATATPLIFFAQYRARRYVLARTRWRGIRFGLEPGVAGFVWRSLLHWGLTVLTAGLYWPVKTYWLEKYRTDRTFYGDQRMHQGGSWRMLIKPMLHLYLSAALLAGTIGMLIATEDPRFAPLIFLAVPWFFFGLAAWKAGSFRALTNTKTIGEARLKASPRTGRIVGIYAGGWAAMGGIFIAAGIGVSILFGIIFAATGFALENIDEDGYLTTLGNLPAFVPILFGIITYFAIFIFWGVLKEVFITLPVAQHFAETTEIENPQALLDIKQRARDEFAEAEGFADALPLGDAF